MILCINLQSDKIQVTRLPDRLQNEYTLTLTLLLGDHTKLHLAERDSLQFTGSLGDSPV